MIIHKKVQESKKNIFYHPRTKFARGHKEHRGKNPRKSPCPLRL